MFPISTHISFISLEYINNVCQTKPLKETVKIENNLYQQLSLLKQCKKKKKEFKCKAGEHIHWEIKLRIWEDHLIQHVQ